MAREYLRRISDALVAAQRPIRILKAMEANGLGSTRSRDSRT